MEASFLHADLSTSRVSEQPIFTVRLASPTVRYPCNQAIMQDLGVQNDSHKLVTQLGMDF